MAYKTGNTWLSSHDSCLRLHRDVWTLMSDRSNFPRTSHAYSSVSEKITDSMAKLSKGVDQLKVDLVRDKSDLTQGEYSRREGLVAVLVNQEMQLKNILSRSVVSEQQKVEEQNRRMLLTDGGGVADLDDVRWSSPVTGRRTVPTDVDDGEGVAVNVERTLADQDQGLDNLHSIIVRQRRIAENIDREVEAQNEIVDGLGDDLLNTNARVLSTTQRTQTVIRTSSGVGKYWTVIVLLLILIVVLVCLPS